MNKSKLEESNNNNKNLLKEKDSEYEKLHKDYLNVKNDLDNNNKLIDLNYNLKY